MTRMKHTMNMKAYEQSNHLGNVVVTVSDARQVLNSGASVTGYMGIVKSASDYSSFGVTKAGRTYTSTSYRYSFNGKEKQDELHGNSGDNYDFGARIYNSRLGKFLSVDPDARIYVNLSTYCYAANCPIQLIDKDGRGPIDPKTGTRISSNCINVYSWSILAQRPSTTPGPYAYDENLGDAAYCNMTGSHSDYDLFPHTENWQTRPLTQPYYTFFTVDGNTTTLDLTYSILNSEGSIGLYQNYQSFDNCSEHGTYSFASEDVWGDNFTVYTVQDGWINREAYFMLDEESNKYYRATEKIYTTEISDIKTRQVVRGQGGGADVQTESYREVTSREQINYYDKNGNITSTEYKTYTYEISADPEQCD